MMPNSFRVEVADNGFVVRYDDPALVKKNHEDKGPWVDPERTAVFPDVESMKAGLDTVIDMVVEAAKEKSMEGDGEFKAAFAEATSD